MKSDPHESGSKEAGEFKRRIRVVTVNSANVPFRIGSSLMSPGPRNLKLVERLKQEEFDIINVQEAFPYSRSWYQMLTTPGAKILSDSLQIETVEAPIGYSPSRQNNVPNSSGVMTFIRTTLRVKPSFHLEEMDSLFVPHLWRHRHWGDEKLGGKGNLMTQMEIKSETKVFDSQEESDGYFITNATGHLHAGMVLPDKAKGQRKHGRTGEFRNQQIGFFHEWFKFLDQVPPPGKEHLRWKGTIYSADLNTDVGLVPEQDGKLVLDVGTSHGKFDKLGTGLRRFEPGTVKYEHMLAFFNEYKLVQPDNLYNLKSNPVIPGRKQGTLTDAEIEARVEQGLFPGTDNSETIVKHQAREQIISQCGIHYGKLKEGELHSNVIYLYSTETKDSGSDKDNSDKAKQAIGYTFKENDKTITGSLSVGDLDFQLDSTSFKAITAKLKSAEDEEAEEEKTEEEKTEETEEEKKAEKELEVSSYNQEELAVLITKRISLKEFYKLSYQCNSGKTLDIICFKGPPELKMEPPRSRVIGIGPLSDHAMVALDLDETFISEPLPRETELERGKRIIFNRLANQVKRRYLQLLESTSERWWKRKDLRIIETINTINDLLQVVYNASKQEGIGEGDYLTIIREQIQFTRRAFDRCAVFQSKVTEFIKQFSDALPDYYEEIFPNFTPIEASPPPKQSVVKEGKEEKKAEQKDKTSASESSALFSSSERKPLLAKSDKKAVGRTRVIIPEFKTAEGLQQFVKEQLQYFLQFFKSKEFDRAMCAANPTSWQHFNWNSCLYELTHLISKIDNPQFTRHQNPKKKIENWTLSDFTKFVCDALKITLNNLGKFSGVKHNPLISNFEALFIRINKNHKPNNREQNQALFEKLTQVVDQYVMINESRRDFPRHQNQTCMRKHELGNLLHRVRLFNFNGNPDAFKRRVGYEVERTIGYISRDHSSGPNSKLSHFGRFMGGSFGYVHGSDAVKLLSEFKAKEFPDKNPYEFKEEEMPAPHFTNEEKNPVVLRTNCYQYLCQLKDQFFQEMTGNAADFLKFWPHRVELTYLIKTVIEKPLTHYAVEDSKEGQRHQLMPYDLTQVREFLISTINATVTKMREQNAEASSILSGLQQLVTELTPKAEIVLSS